MSLAEDLPRSYFGSLSRHTPQKLPRVSLADLASRSVSEDGKQISNRAGIAPTPSVHPEAEQHEPAVVPMPRKSERGATGETSLDLLDRASKGMSFILGRYKQLEDHVKQIDAWSNAQIEAAETQAARWQEAAALAEKRLEECQKSLDIMVRRAETAEQCMHRDKEALEVLQSRIIQAFGFGSEAHDAISAGLELDQPGGRAKDQHQQQARAGRQ
ncbi:hypothetical protein [Lichenifustis flavocetrariae]|uniref:Uncharacterized protein n=1 Tax=Lichenifustis flavocetrariae TaxID=2949735 RepID=A0AA41Z0P1_9HYPH|nr:hypothetical protein [Lichenifustis flavocetrariae]MCW6508378.1 hypothetical protein [Lichenifustis flavocetrariae]